MKVFRSWRAGLVVPILLVGFMAGCNSSSPSPYVEQPPIRRDTERARRLANDAVELMAEDPTKAEELFRDALAADLYHGPSHNNLGVLLLGRGSSTRPQTSSSGPAA